MVSDRSGALLEWEAELAALNRKIGEAFKRTEGREMAGACMMACYRARNARPVG